MENSNAKHVAICNSMAFEINGDKSAIFIHNKYSMGTVDGRNIILKPYEAIYLYLRRRIEPFNGALKSEVSLISNLIGEEDIHKLKVYLELKEEGTKISIDPDFFNVVRKNEKQSVIRRVVPVREKESITFAWLHEMLGKNVASVDDDGDVTYYRLNSADLHGKNITEEKTPRDIVKIGKRGLARQEDIPAWMGDRVGSVSFLSEQEFSILTNPESEENVSLIYRNLVQNGMIVKTGFKYGCTFRAYEDSIENHSEYLIHVAGKKMEWYEVSRAVRVAGAVKKSMIFASSMDGKPVYVEIRRIKNIGEFNSSNHI